MNRINWIDWAKAILIMLVVLGHCKDLGYSYFIYAFHIPAFFFVSGYLANYEKEKTGTLKSTLPLVYAIGIYNAFFILLNIFTVGILGIGLNMESQDDFSFYKLVIKPLIGVVYVRNWSDALVNQMWFVWVLILLKVLYRHIYDHFYKYIPMILVGCLCWCCLLNFLGVKTLFYVDRCIMALPFFMAGNLFERFQIFSQLERCISRKWGGEQLALFYFY